MKSVVKNGPVGKVFRTLGFVLLFVSSIVLLTMSLSLIVVHFSQFDFLEDILVKINEVMDFTELGTYILMWVVGLLMLIWTLRKGIVARVLLTVLLVLILVISVNTNFFHPIPFFIPFVDSPQWLVDVTKVVYDIIKPIIDISDLIVPGVYVATFFMLWFVFAYKRPHKLSVFFLRIGSLIFFVALLAFFLIVKFQPDWAGEEVFWKVIHSATAVAHITFFVGSIIGTIGFASK